MHLPGRSRLAALVVGLAAVLVAVGAFVVVREVRDRPGTGSARHVKIPVGGGVTVDAALARPPGSGPFPLVILPVSLASPLTEYYGLGLRLRERGYEAITYVQRGVFASGGKVDLAGPATQRDFSRVLDWALAHEPVEPGHVGAFGTSYGGIVALLGAARDPRIKAVVATSGFADLAGALARNGTPSTAALTTLLDTTAQVGRLDGEVEALRAQAHRDPAAAAATLGRMSPARSPDRVVDRLNANGTAVMLAGGYFDSLLPPQTLVPFFAALTGPKRLRLAPGGHAGPEATGLAGQPNPITDAALLWFDRYVEGRRNGVDREPAVQLEDARTHAMHDYPRWPAPQVVGRLGAPGEPGDAGTTTPARWTAELRGGVDSAATAGSAANAATAGAFQPPVINLAAVDRGAAAVWTFGAVPSDTVLAGTPRLTLTASSTTGSLSLFAYLYDVEPSGTATLLSVTPYTTHAASAPTRVALDLSPLAATLAAGHRLALVIDTVDPSWQSASASGSSVRLAATAAAPATLTVHAGG